MTELSPLAWVTFVNSTAGNAESVRGYRACHLVARVVEETDSREHKFKLVGLVVRSTPVAVRTSRVANGNNPH